jgi:rhodanese-related sulfurtransferase
MATLRKNDPEKAKQFFAQKMAFTIGPVEVARQIKEQSDLVVIDVREAEDYRKGHVPGAISLPYDKWSSLDGLQKDALNILYCYSHTCHLAATAAVEFAGKGFSVMEMDGGFEAWKKNDLEIESEVSEQSRKRNISMAV